MLTAFQEGSRDSIHSERVTAFGPDEERVFTEQSPGVASPNKPSLTSIYSMLSFYEIGKKNKKITEQMWFEFTNSFQK